MIATTTSLWVGSLYWGSVVEVKGLIQEFVGCNRFKETEPI